MAGPPTPSRSRSPGPRSARARRSWCSRCCAPAGSRWARWRSASSATSPPGSGSRTRSPSPAAPPALHLGVRALGWGPGDEVLTSPFSFVASANCLLYEGARPVFCDVDPVTLNLDPAAAEAAVGERTAGILPVHIFGYPAAMPELEALAARARPRHPRGRLRGARRGRLRGPQGRRPRQPRHLRLLRQQADDHGGGGMIVPADAGDRRAAAQRAQPGPRRRHGLARPRAASASTTGSPTSPRRSASPSSSGSTRCSARARRGRPRSTSGRRSAGDRGRRRRRSPDRGAERRSWFVYPSAWPTAPTATR